MPCDTAKVSYITKEMHGFQEVHLKEIKINDV